jgi:hypothetical protein
MNKFINILLLLVALPTMVLAILVGYDLPIEFLRTSGASLPYRSVLFAGIGIFLYLIIVRRSVRRWAGAHMVSQIARFKWNEPMGMERKKQVYLYQALEAGLMIFAAISLYSVCPLAVLPASAFLVSAVDNLVFLFMGMHKNIYRIGLTANAIVVADREVKVLYLNGLRKISIHHQTVFLDYIKDLQMTFPLTCIQEKDKTAFKDMLEAQLDRDKVFFSEGIKNM